MENPFSMPVHLGKLTLSNRVFLAPLAGVSDVPFRRICQEQGAGLTYVEMLSATALLCGSRRTFQMMARHASEGVLGVQVTGPTVEQVEKAVALLHGEGFDTIDINMGCPVRKVVNSGSGSGFLRDPERISASLKAARASTTKPLSAKFRLGFTRESLSVVDTTRRVLEAGLDMFTIHGRTRNEDGSVPVDRHGIRLGVAERKQSNVLAVANGDVFDSPSAVAHAQMTGCDAVMVSRGALGNPWIFDHIACGRKDEPTVAEWLEVVLRHIDYHEEHYGPTPLAAVTLRKHLLWYSKGFPGAKALRDELNTVADLAQARARLRQFAAGLPADLRREGRPVFSHDPKFEMDRDHDRGVGHLHLDEGEQSSQHL